MIKAQQQKLQNNNSFTSPTKLKRVKDYNGRIFVFTSKSDLTVEHDCKLSKQIIEQAGGEVNEIKVDGKPYLQELIKKILGSTNYSNLPQIFFNDEYIGGIEKLKELKENGSLEGKIEECKNAHSAGELHRIYRKQADVFTIRPPYLYFPQYSPPRIVTCSIVLHNRTDKYIVFKLKTTCADRYMVKTKKGVVRPSSNVRIEVSMQKPLSIGDKEDKFRVESIPFSHFSSDMEYQIDTLFAEADPKKISKQKISCKFEQPPANLKVIEQNDGTVMIQPASNSVDFYDDFPVERFSKMIKEQLGDKRLLNLLVFNELSEEHDVEIFQQDNTIPTMSEMDSFEDLYTPRENFESPVGNVVQNFGINEEENVNNVVNSQIEETEECKQLQILEKEAEKLLNERQNKQEETSRNIEENYKIEYNRLEKDYANVIKKLQEAEGRMKEYETCIDQLNERIREKEQTLENERAKRKALEKAPPTLISTTNSNNSSVDNLENRQQGVSMVFVILVALICLLIGKLL
ncbi:hypothetical protein ABK040_012880 [Willaertia magna]